ncbi:hypothetical protein FA13DRAFT_1506283 [Coprinellus micaceus]|uniref:Uncharacterized protein n=1 Tax=Coprinellus micaceus TaxID=71717 RepID=A0A4Y7TLE3_COPMI|nr:hypothetical protein FA13DRAFT_1506283 [Coprinellus micaceus]
MPSCIFSLRRPTIPSCLSLVTADGFQRVFRLLASGECGEGGNRDTPSYWCSRTGTPVLMFSSEDRWAYLYIALMDFVLPKSLRAWWREEFCYVNEPSGRGGYSRTVSSIIAQLDIPNFLIV